MFLAAAEQMGTAPLADFMGRKYSYADMAESVRKFARGLQMHGIGKGDHVGLFLPNVPHYIIAYYGAMLAGATVVNFSPLYTVDELAHQVADSGTSLLVTVSAAALLPTALKVLDQSQLGQLIVGSVAEALPTIKSCAYRLFKRADIAPIPADSRITRFSDFIANDGVPDARAVRSGKGCCPAAIYRRHHRHAQGRDAQPSEYHRQCAADQPD